LALLLVFSAFGSAAADPPDRFVVTFQTGLSVAQRKALVAQRGLAVVEDLDPLPACIVQASPQAMSIGPGGLLKTDSRVLNIEQDFYAKWIETAEPASVNDVPFPSIGDIPRPDLKAADSEKEQVPWGVARVRAPEEWPVTKGAGVKIGIIDTGIGPHEDLHVAGGYNASIFSSDYHDDNGHGTHVAGTVAALLNGKGVVGIAPEAELYAVKVLDKNGGGMATSIVKGIAWCMKNDMKVINMSLGSPRGLFLMHWAVMLAKSRGITIVVAAGNSGEDKPGDSVEYPGAYSEVIAVSAVDANDHIAGFSSRGPAVAFIAPGVDVLSTLPGNSYGRYSGTSMATPHVTGLAALAISRGAKGEDEVRAALQRAASPLPGLSKDDEGAGLIDASKL
jgi:subtilisin family serine protease